jgi:Flp pilus assembly protein TadG
MHIEATTQKTVDSKASVSVAGNGILRRATTEQARMVHGRERGQMLVIMAVLLPVLLGALALGVDVSVFYFEWAQLQKAADASALAGAGYLPGNPDRAIETAQSYAEMNGVTEGEIVSVTPGDDDSTLTVELSREVPYYFGRIFGLNQSPVVARATAEVEGTQSATGVLPVGVDSQTSYTFGQQISLIFSGSSYGPGNWGALALGSPGASTFESNVINGYSGGISVGQWVATQTGQMVGPTLTAFQTRISLGENEYPDATYQDHALNDPRAVTVPMIDYANVNGESQVPVVGFARLWLVSVDQDLNVQAIFLQETVAGGEPGGPSTYGAYQPVLIG